MSLISILLISLRDRFNWAYTCTWLGCKSLISRSNFVLFMFKLINIHLTKASWSKEYQVFLCMIQNFSIKPSGCIKNQVHQTLKTNDRLTNERSLEIFWKPSNLVENSLNKSFILSSRICSNQVLLPSFKSWQVERPFLLKWSRGAIPNQFLKLQKIFGLRLIENSITIQDVLPWMKLITHKIIWKRMENS